MQMTRTGQELVPLLGIHRSRRQHIVVGDVMLHLMVRLRRGRRRQVFGELQVRMIVQVYGRQVCIAAAAGSSAKCRMEDEIVVAGTAERNGERLVRSCVLPSGLSVQTRGAIGHSR